MKYYISTLLLAFVTSLFLPLAAKAKSVISRDACWQKSNGRYTFGDANKDYGSYLDCQAAYAYYLVVKDGKSTGAMAINPTDGKHHCEDRIFNTGQECTDYLLSKYNMIETRPVASAATPTCNVTVAKAAWKTSLHQKVDAIYSELLKRTTNATDYAYWDSVLTFRSCGQTLDEAAIRKTVQESSEYQQLQAKSSTISSNDIKNDTQAAAVSATNNTNDSAPAQTGFWAYVKSIPSRIAGFFKRLF